MADLFSPGRAVISPCGFYRYRLDRVVGAGQLVIAYIGVNPSTADDTFDDQTVAKWRGFSRRLGAARFIVANLFAFRATDVKALDGAEDPCGPENDRHLTTIIAEADLIVPCWGSRSKLPRRLRERIGDVQARLRDCGKPVKCWGLTASGDPFHPLMLGYHTELQDFQ